MPKDSVNLYLSIQSGSSERTVTSLTDKTRALDKETQLLKQATDALAKANKPLTEEQVRLQAQMKASQKTVNELQKAYDEYGDEMMKLDLDQAIEEHARLKTELSEVNAQLGANQKTYKEYLETVRKGSLGDDGGGNGFSALAPVSSESASSGVSAMSLLAGLGIGDKLSSLAQDLGGAMLTSALGSEMGGLATGALSGALSGAAMGSIIPGIGTAVGAVLGGALGAAQGGVRIFEARDDAFKEYYSGLYQDVSGRSGEMVGAGSTLASGRQTDRISFKTMFGDERTADEYLENMVNMANHTPFLYDDLVSMSKTLATYGYSVKEGDKDYILDTLQTIGDAGAALGMSTGDMNSVAQALGRMKSSDKTTLEYLNILNDRGIGAVGMLAEAKGVSQGDMYGMISKGEISGTEAVEIITAALSRDKEEGGYRGAMEEQSQTFAGISSTLEGLEQELQNAGGDAYNTLRQSGKSEMVAAYDGALGDAIKEINAVLGENQARKENLQDQYMREVLDAVLNGNQGSLWSEFTESQQETLTKMSQDYASLMEQYQAGDTDAGAQLEALYEEAQTLGQSYFDNSEEMEKLTQIEKDEIDAIRDAITPLEIAHQRLYELNQTMSRGLIVRGVGISAAPTANQFDDAENTLAAWRAAPDSVSSEQIRVAQETQADAMAAARRNAFGLSRVPYNEYPALLHEGERVLTASEARAQDAGSGRPVGITITGNSFVGTTEEMADQLFDIIVRKLEQVCTAAAPK